jgi:cellulose synthase (UDP-forming)
LAVAALVTAVRSAVARAVLPRGESDRAALKVAIIRVLVAANLTLGVNYVVWRWTASVRWSAWWIAVPLVVAETYTLIDAVLFGLTMWRIKLRGSPAPPPPGATVDVFITTYNEPIDLVRTTAVAAKAIRHPHRTWILDDGARAEMEAVADEIGVGYITRSEAWKNRPRHAKAGNLNNALMLTTGEFMLILDADQIPEPDILDQTLGYFREERVALVQTPQYFTNVGDSDPLGSQAPLFYGPIQQGKDGWNAAFFCGSNAVLRREALMQLGLSRYVHELEEALAETLQQAGRILRKATRDAHRSGDARLVAALHDVTGALHDAKAAVKRGEPFSSITYQFQRRVADASRSVVAADVAALQADLAAIAELSGDTGGDLLLAQDTVELLAERDWSPLGALESVQAMVRALDVGRDEEAQPVMPLATISVTEDMATAMRLHSRGWRSVYHHEVLAYGLAPEDLATMLQQRLRWAQGTLQVLLRENPLTQRGMSVGQKLMYLGTMWSYLSGFAAIPFLVAPMLYLCFGIRPVNSFGEDFLVHFAPFFVLNQLLFVVVGYGVKTWRGQQYSLALFPLWIRALRTAIGSVYFGQSLGFVVTPKTRQARQAAFPLVRPQLVAMGLLAVSICVGLVRLMTGSAELGGVLVNVGWSVYDLIVLSVIIDAALYRVDDEEEGSPA